MSMSTFFEALEEYILALACLLAPAGFATVILALLHLHGSHHGHGQDPGTGSGGDHPAQESPTSQLISGLPLFMGSLIFILFVLWRKRSRGSDDDEDSMPFFGSDGRNYGTAPPTNSEPPPRYDLLYDNGSVRSLIIGEVEEEAPPAYDVEKADTGSLTNSAGTAARSQVIDRVQTQDEEDRASIHSAPVSAMNH
eukprot:Clim_evm70s33 gene=Clim_evmTU70s33